MHKDWDYHRAYKSAQYMIKMFEYINKMGLFENRDFHFVKKGMSVVYSNFDPNREYLLLRMTDLGNGFYTGWDSRVCGSPWDYKMDYFHQNTSAFSDDQSIIKLHHNHFDNSEINIVYYTEEEMNDECFMFQQQLVLDEATLFGVCCVSWMRVLNVLNAYITCEMDANEIERIHCAMFEEHNDDE